MCVCVCVCVINYFRDRFIMKIINDFKLGQLTQEELKVVLTKIKNRKADDLDKIPQWYERQGN